MPSCRLLPSNSYAFEPERRRIVSQAVVLTFTGQALPSGFSGTIVFDSICYDGVNNAVMQSTYTLNAKGEDI